MDPTDQPPQGPDQPPQGPATVEEQESSFVADGPFTVTVGVPWDVDYAL